MKILVYGASFVTTVLFCGPSISIAKNCSEMTTEKECMLCNCYHESRGESVEGIKAVGKVVMSRKKNPNFPNTVCGVVTDGAAFSWWIDGGKDKELDDVEGLAKCEAQVDNLLELDPDVHEMALFYHTDDISPYWQDTCMTEGELIGSHRFYNDCDPGFPGARMHPGRDAEPPLPRNGAIVNWDREQRPPLYRPVNEQ